MMIRKVQALLLVAGGLAVTVCLFLPLGCESGSPSLAEVRGYVYYRGTPLHSGTIVFTPNEARGCVGPLARAEIQADGSYILRSGDQVGTAAGWHRVTIVAVDDTEKVTLDSFNFPHSLLPDKYRDPELSGLEREVLAGRVNEIDFHLE
jgi:hypothetical protein